MVKWSVHALPSSDPAEPTASHARRTTSACRSLVFTAIDDTTRVVEELLQSTRNPPKAIRKNVSHVQGRERKDNRKKGENIKRPRFHHMWALFPTRLEAQQPFVRTEREHRRKKKTVPPITLPEVKFTSFKLDQSDISDDPTALTPHSKTLDKRKRNLPSINHRSASKIHFPRRPVIQREKTDPLTREIVQKMLEANHEIAKNKRHYNEEQRWREKKLREEEKNRKIDRETRKLEKKKKRI